MNHRRKRTRRNPKCGICTPNRLGNNKRGGTAEKVNREAAKRNADRVD